MNDISLHILDIVQNSIRAEARNIEVIINESTADNLFRFIVIDDGKGMSADELKKAVDPFYSTRTTRKIGLGLPLLKQNAEACGGFLNLSSTPDIGTNLEVAFELQHIDRPDTGDLPATFKALIAGNPDIRFVFSITINEQTFVLDTNEVTEMLDGMPINDLKVLRFLESMIRENLDELKRKQTK